MLDKSSFDTSHELHIYHANQGVKLIKPTKRKEARPSSFDYDTQLLVADVLKTKCNIYFENMDGVIYQLNERNTEFCGFNSVNHAIGKKYFSSLSVKTSKQIRQNDLEVIQTNQTKLFEETIFQEHDGIQHTLSIKSPWYDEDNKIIGLFGCSVVLGQDLLVESLSMMSKLGLLDRDMTRTYSINSAQLSLRQLQCAKLLVQGKTAKEIANQINLSTRTVEHYIHNIKLKLNCRNKTEVAIKLADMIGH